VVTLDLTSPLRLGTLQLRSRLWCGAATWQGRSRPPSPDALARAARGLTAVVGLRAAVQDNGRSGPADLDLSRGHEATRCAQRVAAVHAAGAACLVELTHGGPRSGDWIGERPVGPAPRRDPCNGRTPRPLSAAELEALVESFASAGRRARQAGADLIGVEVADGALLHAYLSPVSHPGVPALDERLEPARRVVAALHGQAPLVITLTADDLDPGGLCASEGILAARALFRAGAAAIVVVAGGRGMTRLRRPRRPPGPLREGSHRRLASWVRREVGIPVGCAGGLRSRAVMDAMIDGDVADFAVLERPFLCEPELGARLLDAGAVAACSSGVDCLIPPVEPAAGARCPSACALRSAP